MIDRDGYLLFDSDPDVARWAAAAAPIALRRAQDPKIRATQLRHGGTWLVGLDLLPNAPDGSIDGVALKGPWQAHVPQLPLHAAQVSVIYPGYPRQDPDESDANHRFRRNRAAAHVDGLLPEGPSRRRFAREYHAYILALPLGRVARAPTVVWRGSHRIMQRAIAEAIGDNPAPETVDITEAYQAARRTVFETCEKVPLQIRAGQSALIHRFALHGTDPWGTPSATASSERMIAFFRPEIPVQDWLASDG